MVINFYPDSDNPEFEKAVEEYAKIWAEDGDKIVETIEKISGLKFKEKFINAIVFDDVSYSSPLALNGTIPTEHKKGTIVHELCHRLLVVNEIKWEDLKGKNAYYLLSHKPVDLILYDAWVELYGENFAEKEKEYEIGLWIGKDTSPYKVAWDWALSMTKEQRAEEFKKYLK